MSDACVFEGAQSGTVKLFSSSRIRTTNRIRVYAPPEHISPINQREL